MLPRGHQGEDYEREESKEGTRHAGMQGTRCVKTEKHCRQAVLAGGR